MIPFVVESWVWYGVTMTMVILRLYARILHFKAIRRLQAEDWLMLFITILYTLLIVFLNLAYESTSNLIDPKDIPYLTPEDIAARVWGSKIILAVEQLMCAVQWGTKACLLILYWRLTENLVQGMLVKGAAIYVATTYLVMEVLYFGVWCRPFHDYWQTPTDNVQCTTALHHLITNLVFNLTADLLILSIPLPLLLRQHLEFKRKLLLTLPFSLGFFSIVCAILSKHLSFTQPFSSEWSYWYCREASTVMIVSNMPYTWGLARRIFPTFFQGNHDPNVQSRVNSGMSLNDSRIQEIQGVPPAGALSTVTTITRIDRPSTGSQGKSLKKSGLFSWFSKIHELPMPFKPEGQSQWTDIEGVRKKSELTFGSDRSASSGSSSGRRPSLVTAHSESRSDPDRAGVDPLDRLYRLSDDELMADLERGLTRTSGHEHG